ncbi:inositol monophosphatase family protein [Thiobacillus sp. 65-1402]|uniref:inositol monophosphatase family protein n=1 Tax=Thiobacillus sp. 65-1402 TaxID=1895861 RepID=UPI0025FD08D1|nr:inositol monophosphatase family protein [Thiobacillus sp. 65-1402]
MPAYLIVLNQIQTLVRRVAQSEVTPRFLKVAHSHKRDGSLFTEADVAAQAALEAGLPHIKDVPVLGEEMTEQQQRDAWEAGRDGLWCVDPIDGTSNFVAGVPYFAVSVAYLYKGERQLGVVYDPVADEMFTAERGRGAHLNGIPLPLRTPATELRRALAGVEMKRIDRELAGRLAAWPPYASQRNFGASTLDWCYTAAGRFDVYVHGGQKLWDYAAGALILEEAGGRLASLSGSFDIANVWERSVVASASPELFELWRDWLKAAGA